MARFFIVDTVDWSRNADGAEDLTGDGAQGQCTGCAWLFRAEAGTEDVEGSLREAVVDYFMGEEGRRVRAREELSVLRWEDAIRWVPDEVWSAHGLAILRHPEVERLLLDDEEDLLEEIEDRNGGGVAARADFPLPAA